MTMYNSFRYSPLDQTSPSIRILRVLPSTNTNQLTCELRHVELTAKYSALSYQWGDASRQFPIDITASSDNQGGQLLVRENLLDFLLQARQLDQGTWFWIDAICINQEDTPERNQQVAQMGEIYSQAYSVWIWLGEEKHTADILSCISEVARDTDLPISDLFDHNLCPPEYSDIFVPEKRTGFLQNTYWSRTWIVQEVLLARKILVQSGAGITAWSNISGLYTKLSDKQSPFMQRILGGWRADRDLVSDASVRRYALVAAVDAFGATGCADVRDHIYGVRALVIDGHQIDVDYAKSAQQLLEQVVHNFSIKSTDLQPLLRSLEFDFASLLQQVSYADLWRAQKVLSENPIFLGNGISRINQKHRFPLCQSEATQCIWSQSGLSVPCSHCLNIKAEVVVMDSCQEDWCSSLSDWLSDRNRDQSQRIQDYFQNWISVIWPDFIDSPHDSSPEHCRRCAECALRVRIEAKSKWWADLRHNAEESKTEHPVLSMEKSVKDHTKRGLRSRRKGPPDSLVLTAKIHNIHAAWGPVAK